MSLGQQVLVLFTLALPVASVAWTVTHEAIFREMQEYCRAKSQSCNTVLQRKFFYLFTCEYCFSHWVAAFFVAITGYQLLFRDWRGYLISLFTLVWIANFLMSAYGRLRLDLRRERIEVETAEKSGREQQSHESPRNEPRMVVRK